MSPGCQLPGELFDLSDQGRRIRVRCNHFDQRTANNCTISQSADRPYVLRVTDAETNGNRTICLGADIGNELLQVGRQVRPSPRNSST